MTPSNRPPAVPHAETLPCPAGGLHVLTNDRQARTYCAGCGLSVHDLPDDLGDRELVREQFFTFAADGSLFCNGCAASGEGVFQ